MAHDVRRVPYGYEQPEERARGTLIYYDSFEMTSVAELDAAAEAAEARSFARFVLYPVHEETMKRMSKAPVSAYYKREKRLREWMEKRDWSRSVETTIDGWEGKRKKYTPIDAALRHLTETLPAPYCLYLTPELANLFASFASFEDWIGRIRLLLPIEPADPHPRLSQYRARWSARLE